jgi:hypothetical protein
VLLCTFARIFPLGLACCYSLPQFILASKRTHDTREKLSSVGQYTCLMAAQLHAFVNETLLRNTAIGFSN